MKYTKPALSFQQQAQRLIERGLLVSNPTQLADHLSQVNYYRLSAYWYPFKRVDPETGTETFAPGTSFEMIWQRYTFDRELRLLVMGAIEHIEVALLHTRMVEQFTLLHGPFGYADLKNFNPKFNVVSHRRLISELNESEKHSKEKFIGRFRGKYTSEPYLPLWVAAEIMTFGQLFTFFRFLHRAEQKSLAYQFGLFPPVLESWLFTLNFIRNVCAHHARLWNRELPIRPLLPDERHNPEWHSPAKIDNKRPFAVLTLLQYLLNQLDGTNHWKDRLENLLAKYPEIPIRLIGFPSNWRDCPIWK